MEIHQKKKGLRTSFKKEVIIINDRPDLNPVARPNGENKYDTDRSRPRMSLLFFFFSFSATVNNSLKVMTKEKLQRRHCRVTRTAG